MTEGRCHDSSWAVDYRQSSDDGPTSGSILGLRVVPPGARPGQVLGRRPGAGADELAPAPHPIFRPTLTGWGGGKQERREKQPAGDGALAAAASKSGLSEQEVFDLAIARSAWKNMVMVQLGAGNTRLVWSWTQLPALENLGDLHHTFAFRSIDRSRVLLNDSAPTDLERADGNWAPAIRKLSGKLSRPTATVKFLATSFDQHLAPWCKQPLTRAYYWRALRLVITWAVARKAIRLILSVSLDTLKALTWVLVCFLVQSSQVEMVKVWKAYQALHRQFQLPPPLLEVNQYSAWVRFCARANSWQ